MKTAVVLLTIMTDANGYYDAKLWNSELSQRITQALPKHKGAEVLNVSQTVSYGQFIEGKGCPITILYTVLYKTK